MRLIDADALWAFVLNHLPHFCTPEAEEAYSDVLQMIKDERAAPTIEAEPVKHSQWKYYHKQGKAVCMNCSFERDVDDNFGRAVSCPNCGAKMDGDGNA